MEVLCALCGRDSNSSEWYSQMPSDHVETQNEIANLERVLEELQSGEASVLVFSENRYLMCTMCQPLMDDIMSESDRPELEERINRQIMKLEEHLDARLPGQL